MLLLFLPFFEYNLAIAVKSELLVQLMDQTLIWWRRVEELVAFKTKFLTRLFKVCRMVVEVEDIEAGEGVEEEEVIIEGSYISCKI